MTETITELDIVTLVGEMPALGCEHPTHGAGGYVAVICHVDGNEQYVSISNPCGCSTETVVFCGRYVEYLKALGGQLMECTHCGKKFPLRDAVFVLGPVREYQP